MRGPAAAASATRRGGRGASRPASGEIRAVPRHLSADPPLPYTRGTPRRTSPARPRRHRCLRCPSRATDGASPRRAAAASCADRRCRSHQRNREAARRICREPPWGAAPPCVGGQAARDRPFYGPFAAPAPDAQESLRLQSDVTALRIRGVVTPESARTAYRKRGDVPVTASLPKFPTNAICWRLCTESRPKLAGNGYGFHRFSPDIRGDVLAERRSFDCGSGGPARCGVSASLLG